MTNRKSFGHVGTGPQKCNDNVLDTHRTMHALSSAQCHHQRPWHRARIIRQEVGQEVTSVQTSTHTYTHTCHTHSTHRGTLTCLSRKSVAGLCPIAKNNPLHSRSLTSPVCTLRILRPPNNPRSLPYAYSRCTHTYTHTHNTHMPLYCKQSTTHAPTVLV